MVTAEGGRDLWGMFHICQNIWGEKKNPDPACLEFGIKNEWLVNLCVCPVVCSFHCGNDYNTAL